MTTVFLSHPPDKLDQYYGARAVAALQAVASVRFNPAARELELADLIVAARGCDAIVAYRQTAGPEALFTALPQLAAFLRCAVDISTIDIAAASRHGVLVTQASAGFVTAVAEWAVAAMIDLARGIVDHAEAYRRGAAPATFVGRELRDATIGVIGYGRIARRLCRLALAFDMHVLVSAPETIEAHEGIAQTPLADLLAGADFVVCLAPSTPETRELIGANAFAAMRRGAFFVNASRGELVDEAALLAALDRGQLAGAALDVGRAADQMPSPALARHPRVLATPHIGGLTRPAIEHQSMETVTQIAALVRGEFPTGAVNAPEATRILRWPGFTRAGDTRSP